MGVIRAVRVPRAELGRTRLARDLDAADSAVLGGSPRHRLPHRLTHDRKVLGADRDLPLDDRIVGDDDVVLGVTHFANDAWD